MELVGEQKKIQALFSEARLADRHSTPAFAGVWNRAQARTYRPRKAFTPAFVVATALLVCALVSLVLWSTRSQRTPQVITSVPAVAVPATLGVAHPDAGQQKVNPPRLLPKRVVSSSKSNALKLAVRREAILVALLAANKKAARDAKAITSWRSPTATLLDSPSDGLLKSLPQMNQTVDEMKSFLPSQPK